MVTRKEYMQGKIAFAEYYRGIALAAGIRFESNHPLVLRARVALDHGDVHLNTIPLAVWDKRAWGLLPGIARAFRAFEDTDTLAGRVCVLKQAVIDAANRGVESCR